MTRKARDEIAAGLHEAIAVTRGIEKPARVHAAAEIDGGRSGEKPASRNRSSRIPMASPLSKSDHGSKSAQGPAASASTA
jgi:hypothetical protein